MALSAAGSLLDPVALGAELMPIGWLICYGGSIPTGICTVSRPCQSNYHHFCSTMSDITKADLIRHVLPEVQERVSAGTFDDTELYESLCVIARIESEFRSDTECEELADSVHDWITARIS